MVNELIIDTENAIRHLDTKIQNTFRYLATRDIKQIIKTNTPNTLHKRHQHTILQTKYILEQNNITIARTDKGTTITKMQHLQ
jgi:hypothetical protein